VKLEGLCQPFQSGARQASDYFRSLDQQAGDLDPRPDFVDLRQGSERLELACLKDGLLARQSTAEGVQLVRLQLPRWYQLAADASVQVVSRSVQGAYTGQLAGVPIAADDLAQDQARKLFYDWQRPLQKPGDG
jgi:hypothetical protein